MTKNNEKIKNEITGELICPVCHFAECQCEEIEREKQEEEKRKQEQEQEEKRQQEQYDILRLGGKRQFLLFTEKNFKDKNILRKLQNFPKENYYIWGSTGTGKTHLAVSALRKVKDAKLIKMSQISQELRLSYDEDKVKNTLNENEIIEKYAKITMCLDDLGSQKMTEFLQSILYEIIDTRWSNMSAGLIITSNYDLTKLAEVAGDRIVSRIFDLCGRQNIIKLEGKDHRIK